MLPLKKSHFFDKEIIIIPISIYVISVTLACHSLDKELLGGVNSKAEKDYQRVTELGQVDQLLVGR